MQICEYMLVFTSWVQLGLAGQRNDMIFRKVECKWGVNTQLHTSSLVWGHFYASEQDNLAAKIVQFDGVLNCERNHSLVCHNNPN